MKTKPGSPVQAKAPAASKTAKTEFTFELAEEDFDRLIFEPFWSIDYIANVFRELDYRPAQAAIRLLDEAYRGFHDYFVADEVDAVGVMSRPENKWQHGRILSAADVLAYREKLSPMFELIDLTEDMNTEDELYQAVSIVRIMGQFFEHAGLELEVKLEEAQRKAGAE